MAESIPVSAGDAKVVVTCTSTQNKGGSPQVGGDEVFKALLLFIHQIGRQRFHGLKHERRKQLRRTTDLDFSQSTGSHGG